MAWKKRPKETKNFCVTGTVRSRVMCKNLWGQGDRASQSPMDLRNHGWFSRRDM